MPTYPIPGVYRKDVFPEPVQELRTGVPAFLGFTESVPKDGQGHEQINIPHLLTLWAQFEENFGPPLSAAYLGSAVRGFFENGGSLCYVVPLDKTLSTEPALREGLAALGPMDTVDLVCAPDIMRPRPPENLPPDRDEVHTMQAAVLEHCDTSGDRFAILDAHPGASLEVVMQQRLGLNATNAALYYPWVRVPDGPALTGSFVPPCGHVAGVYARSDQRVGVHKAPANDVLQGVLDLEVNLTDAQQGQLNPAGVNCLRAFPGRGIRVWGARTLSRDPAWTYINVRRLFLTAGRWIEHNMAGATFEPNDPRLWARIGRELTAYFVDLFRRGALKGRSPQEAFYVKCDAEINSPAVREAGMVVTEIGLAPSLPYEFVVVRVIQSASGVTIAGPTQPG
jgi:Bacteriophage tail sheath protein